GYAVSSRYRKNHRTSTLVEGELWGPQQQEPVHAATHRAHPWPTAPGTHVNPHSPETEQSKTNGEDRVTSDHTRTHQPQPHLQHPVPTSTPKAPILNKAKPTGRNE